MYFSVSKIDYNNVIDQNFFNGDFSYYKIYQLNNCTASWYSVSNFLIVLQTIKLMFVDYHLNSYMYIV